MRIELAVAILLAILYTGSADAQTQQGFPAEGSVTATAPVFLFPDPNRTPLATLRVGAYVRVLEAESDWYRVEFKDNFGTRTGFIESAAVRVGAPVPDQLTRNAVQPSTVAASTAPGNAASRPLSASSSSAPATPVVAASAISPRFAKARSNTVDRSELQSAIRAVGLTTADVEMVIASGLRRRGQKTGLLLVDAAQQFSAALGSTAAALGSSGSGATASNGFSVHVYTPLAWIEQLASDAAKEYRTFNMSDLTPEVFEPVVRLVVYPDTPNTVSAQGMTGTSSVRHVVLRDEKKRVVIQPISKEPFTETAANAMGARVSFEGLNAKFSLEGLREIRGASDDGEFFVTVVGTSGEERDFKVKRKHFERLR